MQFGAEPVQFGPRLPGGGVIQVEDLCKPPQTYNNQPLCSRSKFGFADDQCEPDIDNIEKIGEKKHTKKSRRNSEFFSLFEFVWLDSHRNVAKKASLAELSASLQRYLVTATLGCQFGQRGNDWQESAQKKYFTHSLAEKRFPVLVFLGKG